MSVRVFITASNIICRGPIDESGALYEHDCMSIKRKNSLALNFWQCGVPWCKWFEFEFGAKGFGFDPMTIGDFHTVGPCSSLAPRVGPCKNSVFACLATNEIPFFYSVAHMPSPQVDCGPRSKPVLRRNRCGHFGLVSACVWWRSNENRSSTVTILSGRPSEPRPWLEICLDSYSTTFSRHSFTTRSTRLFILSVEPLWLPCSSCQNLSQGWLGAPSQSKPYLLESKERNKTHKSRCFPYLCDSLSVFNPTQLHVHVQEKLNFHSRCESRKPFNIPSFLPSAVGPINRPVFVSNFRKLVYKENETVLLLLEGFMPKLPSSASNIDY